MITTWMAILYPGWIHTASAQNKPETQLQTYYMVFLFKGPVRNQDSVTTERLQEAHMANIRSMADAGTLAIAGPFLDDGDLRGIFILNVGSRDEAKQLAESDPAVRAGRLRFEIHPWMSQRGARLP
jgi:uncharacterized protein